MDGSATCAAGLGSLGFLTFVGRHGLFVPIATLFVRSYASGHPCCVDINCIGLWIHLVNFNWRSKPLRDVDA